MNATDLEDYAAAWNAHDIERIMAYMTPDCIFETGGGSETYGTRFAGAATVRQRFIDVWTELPDVQFRDATHFAEGSHGCSRWTFCATRADGSVMEVEGCDLRSWQ
jgi:ketosteroid isomerase-like protein